MSARHRLARAVASLTALLVIAAPALVAAATPASAAPARINGSGSSYVGLAMQLWVSEGQVQGLPVNYLSTSSPQGLQQFASSTVDFAGTEAEFSALGVAGGEGERGYQYVPDVAGAVAVMYNVKDKAGNKVDTLRLSRRTIARIFMGDIAKWSDDAITADNGGLQLPDQPITVVYRAGQSGTTGLFYDFVQKTAPEIFGPWAARNQLPTGARIITLDGAPGFAPNTRAYNGSDQIAQGIAGSNGLWSIGYDEFGYAKTYKVSSAWVQNQAGQWVKPYAANITAALTKARLAQDLSQDLTDVYTNPDPLTYPISAYSYIVTQCAPDPARPTCKGKYTNPGVAETLTKWLRYIACEGQVNMAKIGYAPLPTNLSQEVANAIGRMNGVAPEQLNAQNCANPRFTGGGIDPPPTAPPIRGGGGGTGSGGGTGGTKKPTGAAAGTSGAVGSASGTASATGAGAATAAEGSTPEAGTGGELAATDETLPGDGSGTAEGAGSVAGAGTPAAARSAGGSAVWRDPEPVAYDRPGPAPLTGAAVVVLVALMVGPTAFGAIRSRRTAR